MLQNINYSWTGLQKAEDLVLVALEVTLSEVNEGTVMWKRETENIRVRAKVADFQSYRSK